MIETTTASPPDTSQQEVPTGSRQSVWTWAATAVALIAVGGSLWLSLGMGLKACALCYYQRTFVMGVLGVMVMGLLAGARPTGLISLLALPLAVAALGVALFHENLEMNGKLECPAGILGLGTAPQQSLVVVVILVVFLGIDVLVHKPARRLALSLAGVLLLGGLSAYGCIKSAAPAAKPTEAYKAPPDICRPPFAGVPNP